MTTPIRGATYLPFPAVVWRRYQLHKTEVYQHLASVELKFSRKVPIKKIPKTISSRFWPTGMRATRIQRVKIKQS